MTGPLAVLLVGTPNPELQALGKSFRKFGVSHRHLSAGEDGAMDAYFQKGLADALFVPTLIMLDMDTCDPEPVLSLLKHHSVLRRIPVIIYGQGNDPERVHLAYRLGATCYLPKPESWDTSMPHFCSYWKKRVALPAIKVEDILATNPYPNQSNRKRH
ncbi:hypothetical protein [Larkinella rosea]|uniref:Response regulator n=1 Tax=Larkinella rosea TaxID=2025312 RepID=A0A3P1BIT2_9BACT|nr:hypothetical protein [Larkinella rosea]RRB01020.1 hypothetical protein EHT25_22840 [Larkinella rosea]